MFFNIIITVLLLVQSNSCPIRKDQEYSVISDFSSFKDLNFTNCNYTLEKTLTLEIRPNKQIILDNTLNMTGLKIASPSYGNFGFMFTNIKGIDHKPAILLLPQIKSKQNLNKEVVFWNFKSSNFNFYFGDILFSNVNQAKISFFHIETSIHKKTFLAILLGFHEPCVTRNFNSKI